MTEQPAGATGPAGSSPAGSAARLPALSHRNYRLYFGGQLVSVTGTWMQMLAQSWLVLSLTSSPLKLALVNVMQFAPILFLGLFAGVVADRFSRRKVLLVTQAFSALLALTLAILDFTDRVVLWQVYVLALGLGIVNAFDMPARQAFVVEMVGPEDLPNAIALNASIFNAGRLIGPAIAGVLLAFFGTAFCFSLNAASYLAVIAALLMMRLPQTVQRTRKSGLGDLLEGLSYVRTTRAVGFTLLLVGLTATFALNFSIWMPLLAKEDFDAGPRGFGLLMATLGLGSLVGALVLAFYVKRSNPALMVGTAALLGAAEIAVALVAGLGAHIAVGLLIIPVMGFAMTMTMASANTFIQTSSPPELRGRVMSVYMTVFAGTAPAGALFAGAVSSAFSTPVSLALGGVIALVIASSLALSGVFKSTPLPLPGEIPAY